MVQPDDDGVIRKAATLALFKGQLYPSLAFELARQYFGLPELELITSVVGDEDVIEAISIGGFMTIPTDGKGRVIVPYRGPSGSYTYISAADVLNGSVKSKALTDAIVLVGTTAEGLYDLRSTPFQSVFPGVEIHANIISGILDEYFPYEPSWAKGLNLTVILVLGLLIVFMFPVLSPIVLVIMTFVLISGYVGFNYWIWSNEGLAISMAMPSLMVFFIATVNLAYGFIFESKSRRQLTDRFGQYVPPQLVEEMNKDPEGNFGLDGESREMTVLFADIQPYLNL